ncbi:FAD:protein FMN transferase [Sinorhizobium mexicanum]|uniref:FAD:protein FMN transferase n=1 Tax=Sinorhizobium mexicanum TaxID=375549 RepID=A0A859R134_9HYPH|nr:FAD:protein FMN transferase [Sinorhizobium mexicanum]MBP1886037.1 thiamine biosynthesis lipoprotein [Sinorhizobium mexicanum]QLL65339.1 FAD:protein FMN transferase [Sinorhizobium mexicanum]
MGNPITRRRAICIMAAAAGLPLLGSSTGAKAAAPAVTWKGQALGAPATLVLHLDDKAQAERLIDRVFAEVSRLESVFSLYRSDSILSELNRAGAIAAPPSDLVRLLEACRSCWEATNGAFDPTVQPLWALYARHFSVDGADPAGPSDDEKRRALARVGFDKLRLGRDRVVFTRPGMALTLNGVAQGYITDCVVELLKDAGVATSLVSMGEIRAIGARSDGTPWRVGLAPTEDTSTPDSILDLVNKAVATSSQDGFVFGDSGRSGHIVDPHSGEVPRHFKRLSVIAPTATEADAFSTAFSLMDTSDIQRVRERHPDLAVDLVSISGERSRLG